jgi:hypothetical protein
LSDLALIPGATLLPIDDHYRVRITMADNDDEWSYPMISDGFQTPDYYLKWSGRNSLLTTIHFASSPLHLPSQSSHSHIGFDNVDIGATGGLYTFCVRYLTRWNSSSPEIFQTSPILIQLRSTVSRLLNVNLSWYTHSLNA